MKEWMKARMIRDLKIEKEMEEKIDKQRDHFAVRNMKKRLNLNEI